MRMKFSGIALKITAFGFMAFAITSCKKDDKNPLGPSGGTITLDCDHFTKNPKTILKNSDAAVDYIVTCKMQIDDDVMIEPGTTIAFEENAGFEINEDGSLSSNGTANSPVTLTGKLKTKGYWAGIMFHSESSKNQLSYTQVEYAGGDRFNSNNDRGGIVLFGEANFKMNNSKIANSATSGLNASYRGVQMELANNTYEKNDVPMTVLSDLINMISGTDSYIGNTKDYVHLMNSVSNVKVPTLMRKLNVPYRMSFVTAPIPHLEISNDMTIEPGVILEMDASTSLYITKNGSLNAVGTTADPIIIRGFTKQPGSWENIYFEFTSSVKNQLKNMKIQHAGGNPTSTKGAVYMWAKPTLNVENVEFSDILTCALYAAPSGSSPNPNLTSANLTYINCGGEICGD